ncbi:MAG: hypothetical protein OWR62_14870, partial [Sulfobacillus thermotolerans]|nr:hypothetical protein [Sulfobacillus thermotolerans]
MWVWLNSPIWATSCSLVVNSGYTSQADDTYVDAEIVHVLAGQTFNHDPEDDSRTRLLSQWSLDSWDRDMELFDYANFFQLWVDMRTGFCRRITAEGENGRMWDIIIDKPVINGQSIPLEIFDC